jgi:hypothetical protein
MAAAAGSAAALGAAPLLWKLRSRAGTAVAASLASCMPPTLWLAWAEACVTAFVDYETQGASRATSRRGRGKCSACGDMTGWHTHQQAPQDPCALQHSKKPQLRAPAAGWVCA